MVLQPRSPAPQFTAQALIDGEFKELSLSDYKGKYVVLFAWPFDFTFVCPTEICAFSDRYDDFKKLGAEVIGFSCDSVFTHFNWTQQERKDGGLGHINFPMVADTNQKISRDYQILYEDEGCPCRGLFIIDPEQKIRIMMINDLPVGRSVDEALRLLEALQFTDKHGEVCPANWQAGQATIKPEISDSKDFFAKAN
ncbi:Peroxiredoxin 1 [Coemansia sp. RSA 2523]|nr:Peroxiredoxin 1 [Coemansia sp. RSA 1591]KAJ1759619.1 Peroxiredoxin 1 [Coemansia sp. RSA 1752]KAJ1774991.1 Peroxiredoxin 1 [Coemansia sp. RSA 2167]KAJ1777961.1 Peroxiredoxin 1 [Coemansia sp. RSA 1824]KAJ1786262.1 Peroxiredoxin 1 [Coemansia sp. RSA 1938]KAJ1808233.1 Peroxiredoxin 1 [Coemansia sp. RSA 2523]KAJ2129455.1 Peroxiredoxin 1 [Coemansia sp. RSA 921]KAJ2135520.1 Peroxiredoxin 1 [Coemansia sp. RSA 788]KAJ2138089.1 Peroxiredoxin 1 [Coemansia sp. RSA 637]KAJ2143001.1 Peroxiredoxin 1 [